MSRDVLGLRCMVLVSYRVVGSGLWRASVSGSRGIRIWALKVGKQASDCVKNKTVMSPVQAIHFPD